MENKSEGNVATNELVRNSPVKRTFVPDLKDEDIEEDYESLEYEEDCYYSYVAESGAPSFDHCWPDDENLPISGLDDSVTADVDPFCVEAEFYPKPTSKKTRSVRVTFQDLSKPYFAKVSSPRNYRRFLQLVKAEEAPVDMSPDSGFNELHGLTPEEQERQRQEWQQELAKVEEEIQTLRQVLASKVRMSQELKRKLGISAWKEFQDDMSQGIRNVKESNVYQNVESEIVQFSRAVIEAPIYQKTESVIKTTAEKTSSLLGGFGSSVSTKLGQLKNSESFRSFEERVGSAYENVKTKVVTSRSNSTQSFDEALREAEANRKSNSSSVASPATTPSIPEDRPLS